MIKRTIALLGIAAVLLFFIANCRHEPPVQPGTGGNNNNNPPPVTSNCNPDTVYFENNILPLLRSNCGMPGCHDAISTQDGFDVTTYNSIMSSGNVKAGNPNGSKLIEAINETKPQDRMPQPPRPPLTQEQKDMLTKWIQQGAKNNGCNSGCDTTKFAFAANVKPIIDATCKGCHNNAAPTAGINLETYANVKTYADNGKLMGTINQDNGFKPMPYGGAKMPDCKITIIKKWIDSGALNN